MANQKTAETVQDAEAFFNVIADERQRGDAMLLAQLMQEATGAPPVMWGSSIVGFGSRHYRYESGREGDTATVAFSPRKGKFALYGLTDFEGADEVLGRLGKHATGKGCLYIKRLTDIDESVLRELISRAYVGWAVE